MCKTKSKHESNPKTVKLACTGTTVYVKCRENRKDNNCKSHQNCWDSHFHPAIVAPGGYQNASPAAPATGLVACHSASFVPCFSNQTSPLSIIPSITIKHSFLPFFPPHLKLRSCHANRRCPVILMIQATASDLSTQRQILYKQKESESD